MSVGWPHRPLIGRVGRAGPRRAAVALDRGDERRLLAADEGAGADADVDAEAEAGVEDAAAQELRRFSACLIAVFSRWIASGYSPRT